MVSPISSIKSIFTYLKERFTTPQVERKEEVRVLAKNLMLAGEFDGILDYWVLANRLSGVIQLPIRYVYGRRRYELITDVEVEEKEVTVETTATKILSADEDRLYYILVNLSPDDMYVAFTSDVSAAHGILITGNGGMMTVSYYEDFALVNKEVWALGISGGQTLYMIMGRQKE